MTSNVGPQDKLSSINPPTDGADNFSLKFSMKPPQAPASFPNGYPQPYHGRRMVHQRDIRQQGDRITSERVFDETSNILAEVAAYKHGGPVKRICMEFAIYETTGPHTTKPDLQPHHAAHLRKHDYGTLIAGVVTPLYGDPLPEGKILFESWEDVMVCDEAACTMCAPDGAVLTVDGLPFVHRCEVEDGVLKRDQNLKHHGGLPKAMIFKKVELEFPDGKRRDVAMCDEYCGFCLAGGMPEEPALDEYDPDKF